MTAFVVASLLGKYSGGEGEPSGVEDVWAWFLPTIMPTLLLIVGVLVVDATSAPTEEKTVDRFVYRLAFGLSALYLVLVALVPLLEPLTNFRPLELMRLSSLWLGPLQGLVAATLAAFFVRSERGG